MSHSGQEFSLMQTYGHRFKVLVESLSDFICKFAASYPGAILRIVKGRNLSSWSARNSKNG